MSDDRAVWDVSAVAGDEVLGSLRAETPADWSEARVVEAAGALVSARVSPERQRTTYTVCAVRSDDTAADLHFDDAVPPW